MKNKKKILICAGIIIFLTIILIFYYKNQKTGNNINKSVEDLKEYILNISSYEATISVEVISNKNTNKYIIKQWYKSPDFFKQEIEAPENIKGLVTIYQNSNLKIENSQLNLSKIYNDYNCLSSNILDLSSFISDCKKTEPTYTETKEEINIEIKNGNKYNMYKKLTIDKTTKLPTKIEIRDENKKNRVYILYKEITINKTNK